MKLIIKTLVLCITLMFINSTNLKNYKNLDNKYSEISKFDKSQEKFLKNKIFLNENNTNTKFEILDLLNDIGDKTFICIILLQFQTSTIYLVFTSLIMKIIFLYSKSFLYQSFFSEFYFFQLIFPFKIFQFLGVVLYQICGYSILFKMIFSQNEIAFKKIKTEDLTESCNIKDRIKTIFIILFSFYSKFKTENEKENFYFSIFSINKIMINLCSIVIGISIALGIGYFIVKKFSKEFALIISSITFLLLSIDGAVKLFSY